MDLPLELERVTVSPGTATKRYTLTMQNPFTSPNGKQLRIGRAIALFVLLFVAAIPWWWRFLPEIGGRVVMGAPMWFVTSVLGSLVVSVVSARFLMIAWDALEAESESEAEERGDG